jgi:hypothetical protein
MPIGPRLESRRHSAGRPSRVDEDRADHRAESPEHLGGARCRLVATAKGTIQPLADGECSRVTIVLDFEAHGIGKLLVPLLRRQARKQLPKNEQRLKEMLER